MNNNSKKNKTSNNRNDSRPSYLVLLCRRPSRCRAHLADVLLLVVLLSFWNSVFSRLQLAAIWQRHAGFSSTSQNLGGVSFSVAHESLCCFFCVRLCNAPRPILSLTQKLRETVSKNSSDESDSVRAGAAALLQSALERDTGRAKRACLLTTAAKFVLFVDFERIGALRCRLLQLR